MGSDIKQSLAAAEKLLKAGKVAEALAAFDRVVEKSNGNLLTVNRVGDAIASAGQPEKAVPYYVRIADQFSHQGFYPKAIAIRKKILRLTPESAEALVGLGDLYVRQEHSAEARGYYLRAADHLLQKKDYTGARAVYERLVAAEPDDPRHRVRLAETRAAAGEGAEAAEELVELGQRLLKSGKPEDAEKSFRRAAELDPGRQDVMKGLIACLTETGRDDEALKILEDEVAKPDAPIELVTELLILYEVNGRIDDANRVLEGERAHELPEDAFRTLVRFHDRKDGQAELWSRLEPTLKRWLVGPRRDKLLALLDAWPGWTETAHLPALEWRLALAGEDGDETVQVRSLERLIEAYRANEMPAEADKALKRLHELRPPVEDVTEKKETAARKSGPMDEAPAAAPSPADVPLAAAVPSPPANLPSPPVEVASTADVPSPAAAMEVPVEYEAPAVPLSRADEEFVSGRMTQAEILEKYGLLTQAIDQIYEVIERFPGHLEANKHLVTLLRCTSQESTLAQALVKLSLARRAAGRLEVAREAVAEADKLGGIDPHMRGILVELDLFADVPAAPEVAAEPAEAEPAAPVVAAKADKPKKKRTKKKPAEAKAKSATETKVGEPKKERVKEQPVQVEIKPADPTPPPASRDEAVIDFDSFEDEQDENVAEIITEEVAEPVVPEPPLEKPAPSISVRSTAAAMRFEPLPAVEDDQDDDDLSAIAAALDDELFGDDPSGTPASESEESLDEVFAAFRERVEEQVGADDFRTHYDLGIGYKEMGLLDAAIAEFEISLRSEDLFQVSCVMLGLCCREQAQLERAVDWYRQALDALGDGGSGSSDLRYDMAEILAESGDTHRALDLFRDLQQLDPEFRDVSEQVSRLTTTVSE